MEEAGRLCGEYGKYPGSKLKNKQTNKIECLQDSIVSNLNEW